MNKRITLKCSGCKEDYSVDCSGGCQECQACFSDKPLCPSCIAGRPGLTPGASENPLTLINADGTVKVEWVNLGEGLSGNYDPHDEEDINLLRFDVSVKKGDEWEIVDNGSYCTQMPADEPEAILGAALKRIMSEVEDPLLGGSSIKRICEQLSWMHPHWFEKDGETTTACA